MNIKESIAYFKRTIPGEGKLIVDIPEEEQPFHIPFSEDVSIFFLYDKGDTFAVVQHRHVSEENMPQEELLERGINNLEAIRRNEIEVRKYEGVLTFSGSGIFEASLLLIPELWDIGLESMCPNGFIAAIPSRGVHS